MKRLISWVLGLFGFVGKEIPVVFTPTLVEGFHTPVRECEHKRWKIKVKGKVYQCRGCGMERYTGDNGTTIL